jgi:hypothetical protein
MISTSDTTATSPTRGTRAIAEHSSASDELHVSHVIAPNPSSGLMLHSALIVLTTGPAKDQSKHRSRTATQRLRLKKSQSHSSATGVDLLPSKRNSLDRSPGERVVRVRYPSWANARKLAATRGQSDQRSQRGQRALARRAAAGESKSNRAARGSRMLKLRPRGSEQGARVTGAPASAFPHCEGLTMACRDEKRTSCYPRDGLSILVR